MAISSKAMRELIVALGKAAGNEIIGLLGGTQLFVNLELSGLLFESAQDGLVAHAGGGQALGTAMVKEINRFVTVATAGDSGVLPPSAPGLTIICINHGANPMQVYGKGTDTIDDVASGTGVSQMQGSVVLYCCTTAGAWYSEGLATGYSGSFQTFSSVDGLVAHAGGGQGSATPLTAMQNRIVTVATAADSAGLPVSKAGMAIDVTNAAAVNSANIFPATGEAINALAANAAFALAAGKTAQFICYTAGQWHTILSA